MTGAIFKKDGAIVAMTGAIFKKAGAIVAMTGTIWTFLKLLDTFKGSY